MSDTPKTDELAKREFITDGVWIRHARELERENAALREDKARLDWLTDTGCFLTFPSLSKRPNWKQGTATRDVIDLARKEAQP